MKKASLVVWCSPSRGILLEEKLNSGRIELERDGLQERDVVRQDFFISEVEGECNDVVDVVVREDVVQRRFLPDVRNEDGQRLHRERVVSSASFLAELSVSSPRKLFIFIIKKYIYRIKVSKKIIN